MNCETYLERILDDVESAMMSMVACAILMRQLGLQVLRCELLIVLIVSNLDGVVRGRIWTIVQGCSLVHVYGVWRKCMCGVRASLDELNQRSATTARCVPATSHLRSSSHRQGSQTDK